MLNNLTPLNGAANRTPPVPNMREYMRRRDEEIYARTAYAFDEHRRWIDGEPLSPLSTEESYTFPDPNDLGPLRKEASLSNVPYQPRYITVNKAFEILPTPPDAQRPRAQPPSPPASQPYIHCGGRVVGYFIETNGRIITLVEGDPSPATPNPISGAQNARYITEIDGRSTSSRSPDSAAHSTDSIDEGREGEGRVAEGISVDLEALRLESH